MFARVKTKGLAALMTLLGAAFVAMAQTSTEIDIAGKAATPRATIQQSLAELLANDKDFSDVAGTTKELGFGSDQGLTMDRALDKATLDLFSTATGDSDVPTELVFLEEVGFNNPLILRRSSNSTISGTARFRIIGPWKAGTGTVTATDNVALLFGAEGVYASFQGAGNNAFADVSVIGPTDFFFDAGATTIGALAIEDPTGLYVGDGDIENGAATLTLSGGIAEDGDTLSATVSADGTLVMGGNGAFWPKSRTLTVVGGTVTTTPSTAVALTFEPPAPQTTTLAAAPIPALAVNDGATLRAADTASSLTIDALKGFGEVFFTGNVSVGALHLERGQTMTLDRLASDPVAGRTTIGEVSGEGGTVLFGLLGEGGTTGVQAVCDALAAGGFQGTVGFLAADYPVIDFAQTAVTELPCALAVQPGQTLVIRLDQYLDADITWPEAPDTATLRLVEAGPFGGEATLPAWPANVEMGFVSYGDAPNDYTTREDFTTTVNDDGVTVDLTWQNPTLIGKVAWVDVEFDGDSRNSGWLVLKGPAGAEGDYNGMLRGGGAVGLDEIIDGSTSFTDVWNPKGTGVNIDRRPYISPSTISYPEEWTLVTRLKMPEYSYTSILTIGANYVAENGDYDLSEYGVLALSTGLLKQPRDDNDDGSKSTNGVKGDELVLWFIPPRTDYSAATPLVELARVQVPCLTESFHLVTVRYDHGRVGLFLNEYQLMDVMLPDEVTIGPGLQFGSLMGGENIKEAFTDGRLESVSSTDTDDGTVDFVRIYRGLLSDSAFYSLVCSYPYIHKEKRMEVALIVPYPVTADIRYVRTLSGGTVNWVDEVNKPWERDWKGNGIWLSDDDYAEPAEGSLIILDCEKDTTILVNTEKSGLFPSANRTYAQLIVKGEGKVTIKPCDGWETELTDNGEYKYGRLVFSGGQGDKVAQYASSEDPVNGGDANGAGSDAAYFYTSTDIYASVCDLSRDGISLKDGSHVAIRADEGLLRGVTDEQVVTKQLTGPVAGSGYFDYNSGIHEDRYGQKSEYVYVDNFDPNFDAWLISDVTAEHNTDEQPNTGKPTMGTGLFARFMKVPGILYLEVNVDGITANGALSQQKWYRFGYHGDSAEETPTGVAPEAAMLPGDFAKADGLSIRLRDGDTTSTLYVDTAATFPLFRVEAPKADTPAAAEDLRVYPGNANGTQVAITDEIVTARRLTVYDPTAVGGTGADGLAPQARVEVVEDTEQGSVQLITGGTFIHGVGTGAYVAGKTIFTYPLDDSSVARLESANALTFTAAQDLALNTVVAAEGATLTQTEAGNAFRAKAMELGAGSRFAFASETATVDEAITFLGAATLEGTGTAATLEPVAGLAGEGESAEAILDAKERASWTLLNREVGGLPLTKVGAGEADIATDLPPNAGFVDVQAGTLRVATGLAGEGQAVGQASLNVAEGATLAPTSDTVAEDVLAEIPAGRRVSGLGRVDGVLRLGQGATLVATNVTDTLSLSVGSVQTDGLTVLADVNVALPEETKEGLVFLRSDETMLNWVARKRLLAKAGETRWEVLLRYRPSPEAKVGTDYLVGSPRLQVPDFGDLPEDERPGAGENAWPEDDDVAGEVTDQVQADGQIAGGSEGFTQASTKRLTAPDIANAYRCFEGVWARAQRTTDPQSEDYATVDLLMAYEFGISRMALVSDGGTAKVLVEVTLRNVLGETTFKNGNLPASAKTQRPAFAEGVRLTLRGPDGTPFADVEEADEDKVYALGFEPAVSDLEAAHWFLIPYDEAHFPAGKAMTIDARAEKSANGD